MAKRNNSSQQGTFADATVSRLAQRHTGGWWQSHLRDRPHWPSACWGQDGAGQLGDGGVDAMVVLPVTVAGISNATALASGFEHSCAVQADGEGEVLGARQ
ncbi:MAG: hypothetical protein R3F24_06570 [Gammaproteobacteria bacterium]